MKKLSGAFYEFIEPVLEYFGNPEPKTEPHNAACALGHVVWNAVVMESLNPGKDYLPKAKEEVGIGILEIDRLIEILATRKRDCYGDDLRLIGAYDILKKPDGNFSLWTQIIELNKVN